MECDTREEAEGNPACTHLHLGWKVARGLEVLDACKLCEILDEVGGEPLAEVEVDDAMAECVVVFAHAEQRDEPDAARKRALQHALKHTKWLCNKRGLRRVVLHSQMRAWLSAVFIWPSIGMTLPSSLTQPD